MAKYTHQPTPKQTVTAGQALVAKHQKAVAKAGRVQAQREFQVAKVAQKMRAAQQRSAQSQNAHMMQTGVATVSGERAAPQGRAPKIRHQPQPCPPCPKCMPKLKISGRMGIAVPIKQKPVPQIAAATPFVPSPQLAVKNAPKALRIPTVVVSGRSGGPGKTSVLAPPTGKKMFAQVITPRALAPSEVHGTGGGYAHLKAPPSMGEMALPPSVVAKMNHVSVMKSAGPQQAPQTPGSVPIKHYDSSAGGATMMPIGVSMVAEPGEGQAVVVEPKPTTMETIKKVAPYAIPAFLLFFLL